MKKLPIKYFLFPERISPKRINQLKTIIDGQIKRHAHYVKHCRFDVFIEDWIYSLVFESIFELNKIGVISDEETERWVLDTTGLYQPKYKEF